MESEAPIIFKEMSREVPNILYHYTDSDGLRGILTSGKIWTTEIHYLNDKSEIQLAFKYIRNEIEAQKKGNDKVRTDEELDLMVESLNVVEEMNMSVASFTENGDQLSQWRGYSEVGNGYSLGLYGHELLNNIRKDINYRLLPCVYDEKIQMQMVKELVNLTPVLGVKSDPDYSSSLLVQTTFGNAAVSLAAIIKSGGFKEEKEWRLIGPTHLFFDAKFRPGNFTMIPYWEYDFDVETTLESVIIGPTPEVELSERAVAGLISSIFPKNSRLINSIKHSSIPYRKI